MKRSYRVIGMIALCFFLAGCSGYRQVAWRTPEQALEEEETGDRGGPQAGDKVRVTLVTGVRIEGWFVSSSTDIIAILVGASQDEEGGVQKFPRSDIAGIEKYGVKPLATVLYIVVLLGVFVGLLLAPQVQGA